MFETRDGLRVPRCTVSRTPGADWPRPGPGRGVASPGADGFLPKTEDLALEVRVAGGVQSEKPHLVGLLLADERDIQPAVPSDEPLEPAGVVGVDADKVWGNARPYAVTDLGRLDTRCAAAGLQPAAEHLLRTRASCPWQGS